MRKILIIAGAALLPAAALAAAPPTATPPTNPVPPSVRSLDQDWAIYQESQAAASGASQRLQEDINAVIREYQAARASATADTAKITQLQQQLDAARAQVQSSAATVRAEHAAQSRAVVQRSVEPPSMLHPAPGLGGGVPVRGGAPKP